MSRTAVTEDDIDRLYGDGQITEMECGILHIIRAMKEKGVLDEQPDPDGLRACFVGRVERREGESPSSCLP